MRLLFIDWHDVRGDFRETAWMEGQAEVVLPTTTAHCYPLASGAFWLTYPDE